MLSRAARLSELAHRWGPAIAFVLFALLGTVWALAVPPLSAPDEVAHATKAVALYAGQLVGSPDATGALQLALPSGYHYDPAMECYLLKGEVPASCAPEWTGDSGGDSFKNWVANYNPLYYVLVGWPSLLFHGATGLYAMRIVSAVLTAVLLALAVRLAFAAPTRRWLGCAVAFMLSPMVIYLGAVVNPNGAEIAASVALMLGSLRLLEGFGSARSAPGSRSVPQPAMPGALPRWALWVVVVLCASVVANARALGPLWVVILLLIAVLVCGWRPLLRMLRDPWSYAGLAGIAAAGVLSLLWTLRGGSLSSQAVEGDAPLVGSSFLSGFVFMLRHLPDFLQQALGFFGWLDTPLPSPEYWFAIGVIVLVLGIAFLTLRRRDVIVLTIVMAAAVFVPALVQGYSTHQTGLIWQGRYGLFLYLAVGIVAVWLLSRPGERRRADFLSARVSWLAASGMAAFGVLALVFVLYRYTVGIGATFGSFVLHPEWQPPLGWIPLAVVYLLLSAVFVIWAGACGNALGRRAERERRLGDRLPADSRRSEPAPAAERALAPEPALARDSALAAGPAGAAGAAEAPLA